MAAADDQHMPSRISAAVFSQHVGDAIGDAIREFGFAGCRHARSPERIGRLPRSRSVDHRAGKIDARPRPIRDRQREGLPVAIARNDLVQSPSRNGADARFRLQHRRDLRQTRQRLQIGFDQFAARRHGVRRHALPAGFAKKCCGRAIRIELPRREQANVPPGTNAGGDIFPRFIDSHRQAALNKMGGRRKSDRTAADDGYRQSGGLIHDDAFCRLIAFTGAHDFLAPQQFLVR
jgi:hypothetical protein